MVSRQPTPDDVRNQVMNRVESHRNLEIPALEASGA